jgi:steroid 5-alpha reductase family enzyme
MTNEQDLYSRATPRWLENGAQPEAKMPEWTPASPLARFLGGSPAAVVVKLIFVSLIVGALMMWLDLHPIDLWRGLMRFIDRIWSLGFDAVREVGDYIVAGAMIVLPVWLVLRLLNMRHAR